MPGQPAADRPLCRGKTKSGRPCGNRSAAGSMYCGVHGGATRKIGAPSRLDVALADELIECAKAGLAWAQAAELCGVHRSSIVEWRRKGALDLEHDRPTVYAYLVDGLTRALARGERTLLERISAHAIDDWRAAAWLLAQRHPERYARRPVAGDTAAAERAEPRDHVPEPSQRDNVAAILREAIQPPAPPPA